MADAPAASQSEGLLKTLFNQVTPSFTKGGNGKLFRNTAIALTAVFAATVAGGMTGGLGFGAAAGGAIKSWGAYVGHGFQNLWAFGKAAVTGGLHTPHLG